MGKMKANKANRKFIKEEKAVSAVIGVILMVAITVAIAATVYVYVSGMLPGPSGSQKSIGAITYATTNVSGVGKATFKVSKADSGIAWSDIVCKYAKEDASYTNSTAIWSHTGTAAYVTVDEFFTVTFNGHGTWIVDLVYKGSPLFTSATVSV